MSGPTWDVILGDCVEEMARMDECSIDAVVCDPPYLISFMGKEFDSQAKVGRDMQAWHEAWAREALRVLKPGGHLLAFGGTRTSHRLACAIEDAGFEIRDTITWMYGSGFPKSLDVSKAIDKAAGAEREIVGPNRYASRAAEDPGLFRQAVKVDATAPASPDAERWEGWGTALKPAHEPIIVARKPLAGTVAANVLAFGTGALNIDATRIRAATGDYSHPGNTERPSSCNVYGFANYDKLWTQSPPAENGRWPANVVFSHSPGCRAVGTRKVKGARSIGHNRDGDEIANRVLGARRKDTTDQGYADADGTEAVASYECVPGCPVRQLDEQTEGKVHGAGHERDNPGPGEYDGSTGIGFGAIGTTSRGFRYGDVGSASRFFASFEHRDEPRFRYVAKSSSAERNAGLGGFDARAVGIMDDRPSGDSDQRRGRRNGQPRVMRNTHPTVKPIALGRWLVKLVTPPGGTVLTPFAGSGSEGIATILEGFDWIGIERDPEYVAIAQARIRWWAEHPDGMTLVRRLEAEREREQVRESGQASLFDV